MNKRKMEIRIERLAEEGEKKEKGRKNVANCKRVKDGDKRREIRKRKAEESEGKVFSQL